MSKRIFVKASILGRDVSSVDIYHTSASAVNLISSSVDRHTLLSGSYYEVDDEVTDIIAVCGDGGECQNESGSLEITQFSRTRRYFNVHSTDVDGTVSITYPVAAGPTTGTLNQTVNYSVYSNFTIEADATPGYPRISGFSGWYDSETGGNLISTNNPLTITVNAFTGSRGDEFYARFS